MRKSRKDQKLDFVIDKLTSSIENTLTGERFETDIVRLYSMDSRLIKKKDWDFDWRDELKKTEREIYGLTTHENPEIIHGLISLSDNVDHVQMHLLENAAFNRSRSKIYSGVAANLAAFACKLSFERGFGGAIAFVAKSALMDHYEKSLGAKRFAGHRMFIDTRDAYILVKRYFKDFDNAD
jgi:hypothetical protein